MSLEPMFSAGPLAPELYTYDAAAPDAPYASVTLKTYGGITTTWWGEDLSGQHEGGQQGCGGLSHTFLMPSSSPCSGPLRP